MATAWHPDGAVIGGAIVAMTGGAIVAMTGAAMAIIHDLIGRRPRRARLRPFPDVLEDIEERRRAALKDGALSGG
jgi:hypothetical protein